MNESSTAVTASCDNKSVFGNGISVLHSHTLLNEKSLFSGHFDTSEDSCMRSYHELHWGNKFTDSSGLETLFCLVSNHQYIHSIQAL